ncbi:3-dehydroquinate synthase II family protein [Streptomyces sp. NPDC006703]|uniref:3-dehydroquinate synthase II family protein n=1 Tax=Streptomyces sp. NPDC006703 TaxID=3364759 RepID=UPI0036CC87BD
MKLTWIDVRGLKDLTATVIEEAVHVGIDGFVSDDPELLATIPPNKNKVGLILADTPQPAAAKLAETADILIVDHTLAKKYEPASPNAEKGVFVTVTGEESLAVACSVASTAAWTVVEFLQDPSKIPLEILLGATDKAEGKLITVVTDLEDAEITLTVLERGPEGVMLKPTAVGEATTLTEIVQEGTEQLKLEELTVTRLAHVGLGDRVCVDTCSHFKQNEGILVGSHATGMILVSSETHPLPYMPTRPFRVNAAALHSYSLTPANRTRYLAELRSGSELLAVDTDGNTRRVVVGRIKMESRPMLLIEAESPSGGKVNVIAQDDWHVRVLGPGGSVHNITELKPGDVILGYALTDQRHVGYPIREFLHEQ